MINYFTQSKRQSLDSPSKVVVAEKRADPHTQALEHRSQEFSPSYNYLMQEGYQPLLL